MLFMHAFRCILGVDRVFPQVPDSRWQCHERKSFAMFRRSPFLPILLLIAGIVVLVYLSLDESQKRMIAHLAKQVPYLPGRYYI